MRGGYGALMEADDREALARSFERGADDDVRTYTWPWRLPVDDYLGLLRTTSQYAVADVGMREALLASLREVLGDVVVLLGRTRLIVVRSVT